MKKNVYCRDNIIDFFFKISIFGSFVGMLAIILYYICAFASLYNGSDSFDWLLCVFSDFVEIMNTSIEDSPYLVEGSSYPPLAIIMLYPFALICKSVFAAHSNETLSVDDLTSIVVTTPQFWVAILLFFIICTSLIVFLIGKKFDLHGKTLLKVGVIITCSAPFVYAAMRGNTIYFSLIFVLLFLCLKDSKNAAVRELSYVCLAVAGCIKIYPLFFGVFLLKDKKIWQSIRVAIYFFVVFFLSFCLFERGIVDISAFFDNLGNFMSNENRLLGNNNLSISGLLYKLFHLIVPFKDSDSVGFMVLNYTVLAIFFAFGTFAAVYTKSDFSRYVICFAAVLLIPSISYFYVLIFAILPFIEFSKIAETMDPRRANMYYAAFFFLFTTAFILSKFFLIHAVIVIAMACTEIVRVIRYEMPRRKATDNYDLAAQK